VFACGSFGNENESPVKIASTFIAAIPCVLMLLAIAQFDAIFGDVQHLGQLRTPTTTVFCLALEKASETMESYMSRKYDKVWKPRQRFDSSPVHWR
jgi:hypothetical protein